MVFPPTYYPLSHVPYHSSVSHQPVTMKKFDNSLERTIEERLNLELFLSIPTVSIRTLQGGGDLQVSFHQDPITMHRIERKHRLTHFSFHLYVTARSYDLL